MERGGVTDLLPPPEQQEVNDREEESEENSIGEVDGKGHVIGRLQRLIGSGDFRLTAASFHYERERVERERAGRVGRTSLHCTARCWKFEGEVREKTK